MHRIVRTRGIATRCEPHRPAEPGSRWSRQSPKRRSACKGNSSCDCPQPGRNPPGRVVTTARRHGQLRRDRARRRQAGRGQARRCAANVRANRAVPRRVVRYLAAEEGIRQFLDLGTGLPSLDNTHEVAQRVAPDCADRARWTTARSSSCTPARCWSAAPARASTAYLHAAHPRSARILEQASATIDFREPVAIMLLGVLYMTPGRSTGGTRRSARSGRPWCPAATWPSRTRLATRTPRPPARAARKILSSPSVSSMTASAPGWRRARCPAGRHYGDRAPVTGDRDLSA